MTKREIIRSKFRQVGTVSSVDNEINGKAFEPDYHPRKDQSIIAFYDYPASGPDDQVMARRLVDPSWQVKRTLEQLELEVVGETLVVDRTYDLPIFETANGTRLVKMVIAQSGAGPAVEGTLEWQYKNAGAIESVTTSWIWNP